MKIAIQLDNITANDAIAICVALARYGSGLGHEIHKDWHSQVCINIFHKGMHEE